VGVFYLRIRPEWSWLRHGGAPWVACAFVSSPAPKRGVAG